MIRVTKSEKWKDTFFLNLKPIDKLVFIYLYENCDDAGFFDINFSKMISEIGINNQEISLSLKNIEKTFIVSADSERIWLKKFLLHQNRLPLDLKTTEGNYIKYQIESNIPKFDYSSELQEVLKNIKKKTKSKLPSDFIKPTLEEVVNNFVNSEWSFIAKDEVVSIYDYYESVGWKVGAKKMADWNKAFIGCFRRNLSRKRQNQNQNQNNQPQKQTKMDMIVEGNDKIKDFDFNTLRK